MALAWNVPQHFYPYFDVVEVDWPAMLRRSLQAAATDADEILERALELADQSMLPQRGQ